MRLMLLGFTVVMTLVSGASFAQSPCAGYPADKTWTADPNAAAGTLRIQDVNGTYPGWNLGSGDDTHTHPVTVDAVTAQNDQMIGSKMFYETAGRWTITGGGKLSVTWRVNISSVGSTQPAIKVYGSTHRVRLDFDNSVSNASCTLSGWAPSDGSIATAGGRQLGPGRYLLMPMNEWHTVRVDLDETWGTTGRWDAWIDDGGSDWKHFWGTPKLSGGNSIKIGVSDSRDGTYEYSTACLAWGEGAEIPPVPTTNEEVCQNYLDDDGDGDADCDDTDCNCITIPPDCGPVTDVFEKFNVNFEPDAVIPGRVPPHWTRTNYGSPGYTDEDPTNPPGASLFDLPDFKPDPGPYYWVSPGPYQTERQAMYDACMSGTADDPCATGDQTCCSTWSDLAYHTTQPLRMTLILDKIPVAAPIGCGGTGPECMAGMLTIQREVKADDLAFLPIDWTQPVTISADAQGIDKINADGHGGLWTTFVDFVGYTKSAQTSIEWGDDGDQTNGGAIADYRTVSVTLNPGQQNPSGPTALVLGVSFDYNGYPLPAADTSTAFFENVRITYTADLTKPVINLNKIELRHAINPGEATPDDTFTVRNGMSGTTLNYTVADDAPWLTLVTEGAGGTGTSTGEADTVTVQYDTASLSSGMYTGTIMVTWPGMDKSPATLTVLVDVGPLQITRPDFDRDGDVDQADFAIFQECFSGTGMTATAGFCMDYVDLNGDTFVDATDANLFEGCASGPGIVFDPGCLP